MVKLNIQAAAKRRGLKNANQLATAVGVSRRVGVSLWEGKQQPTLTTLEKVCNALDCDLSEIVSVEKRRKVALARGKQAKKVAKLEQKR